MASLEQKLGMLTIAIVSKIGGMRVEVPGFGNGQLEVQFNPTEYTKERTTTFAEVAIPGLDAPVIQFVRGGGDKVSFELLLDSTDMMADGVVADGNDVRTRFVEPLERLMLQHEKLHAPPVVELAWGKSIIDSAVATSLTVKYTLFDTTGAPVRATANMQFRQNTSAAEQIATAHLQSPDLTNVTTVREGDTLPSIAYREYGDSTLWRPIASANSISNPLELVPGQELVVPKVLQ